MSTSTPPSDSSFDRNLRWLDIPGKRSSKGPRSTGSRESDLSEEASHFVRRSQGSHAGSLPSQSRRSATRRNTVYEQQLRVLESMTERPFIVRLWYSTLGRLLLCLRFRLFEIGRTLEQAAAFFYLVVIPFQCVFQADGVFNTLYAVGYAVDAIVLAKHVSLFLLRCKPTERAAGRRRSGRSHSRCYELFHELVPQLVLLLLVIPFDALLWNYNSLSHRVPLLRLCRVVPAVLVLGTLFATLERSQAVEFVFSRTMRILVSFVLLQHWLTCLYYAFSMSDRALWFAEAPWVPEEDPEAPWNSTSNDVWPFYIRALSWSVISFTDRPPDISLRDPDAPSGLRGGRDWEVIASTGVTLGTFFIELYVVRALSTGSANDCAHWCLTHVRSRPLPWQEANFTSIMLRLQQRLETYRDKLHAVDKYLSRNDVTRTVRKRVKRYFQHKLRNEDHDQSLLEQMTPSLRREVLHDIYMRTLRRAPFVFGADQGAITQICSVLRRAVFLPEEFVCRQGDLVTELYILEQGLLIETTYADEVRAEEESDDSDDEDSKMQEPSFKLSLSFGSSPPNLRPSERVSEPHHEAPPNAAQPAPPEFKERKHMMRGVALCEIGFLFGTRQESEIEAIGQTTCLVLEKHAFQSIVKQFPELADNAKKRVLEQLREEESPLLATIEATEHKTQKQKAQLCDMLFAAAAGELEVVREAIQAGIDPNEHDYEGRTALHIAATAGHLSVVELLLQSKASVMRMDAFGKTALQNAAQRGHMDVAKAIRQAGGKINWGENETAGELCDLARRGQLGTLKALLSCGVDSNATDYDKRSALHLAVRSPPMNHDEPAMPSPPAETRVVPLSSCMPSGSGVGGQYPDCRGAR